MDGLRDSVLAFSKKVPGTTAKDIMDMASSKPSSVFIPHGPGAVKDVAAQIRDDLMKANL